MYVKLKYRTIGEACDGCIGWSALKFLQGPRGSLGTGQCVLTSALRLTDSASPSARMLATWVDGKFKEYGARELWYPRDGIVPSQGMTTTFSWRVQDCSDPSRLLVLAFKPATGNGFVSRRVHFIVGRDVFRSLSVQEILDCGGYGWGHRRDKTGVALFVTPVPDVASDMVDFLWGVGLEG